MQGCGFAVCVIAIMLERGANRLNLRVVKLAQLLGEELGLALARDLLGDGARTRDFGAQIVVERQKCELRVRQ